MSNTIKSYDDMIINLEYLNDNTIVEEFLQNPNPQEIGYEIIPIENQNFLSIPFSETPVQTIKSMFSNINLDNIKAEYFQSRSDVEKKVIELQTGTLKIKEPLELKELVEYGSRINKKRGFLFVSKVLGKHIPVHPSVMKKTYDDMAKEINKKVDTSLDTIVIGFAETATALGQGVFDSLKIPNSFYIHSTRYCFDKPIFFEFFEEHCHAPSHVFYEPTDEKFRNLIKTAKNVILVDDEVTTGNTANNMVKALKDVLPEAEHFYLTTILNWSEKEYDSFEYISLYKDSFEFIPDEEALNEIVPFTSVPKIVTPLDQLLPNNYGRFGVGLEHKDFSKYVNVEEYTKEDKILVLGTSEFMYTPYLMAKYMEENGLDVYFQATTRSPANVDESLKSRMEFKDNYFENIDNFLYNVSDKEYDYILICYETKELPQEFTLIEKLKKLNNNVKEINYGI